MLTSRMRPTDGRKVKANRIRELDRSTGPIEESDEEETEKDIAASAR